MPTIPVFATGLALLMRVERPSLPRLAGVACAAAGALVMLGTRPPEAGGSYLLGNALLLLNCLSYALYLVLQKPLLGRLGPLTVVGGAFAAGGAGILLASAPALARMDLHAVPPAAWGAMLYIILVPTALNYVLNSWAIRESGPSLAAAYITLQPLAATAMAALWLGERPGPREGAGGLLILLGLVLVARAARRAAPGGTPPGP
jgi:drug/metabolite transporter (DMT)-like permease